MNYVYYVIGLTIVVMVLKKVLSKKDRTDPRSEAEVMITKLMDLEWVPDTVTGGFRSVRTPYELYKLRRLGNNIAVRVQNPVINENLTSFIVKPEDFVWEVYNSLYIRLEGEDDIYLE